MEAKLVDMLDKVQHALEKLGPDVAHAALGAAQASALQVIIIGVILGGLTLILWATAFLLLATAFKAEDSRRKGEGYALGAACIGIVSTLPFAIAVAKLTNVAAWYGASDPAIWVAYKLMNL